MRQVVVLGLLCLGACGWLALPASSDEKKPQPSGVVEHDFGSKVVSVRTSLTKTDDEGGFTSGYMEKVQVRRLGDRSFLVGQIIHRVGEENVYEGVRMWVPLSAVLELGEFENFEAVEKLFKKVKEAKPRAPDATGRAP
jgi:hypothetical protein